MSQTYFTNFNQIQYSNNIVIDITERVVSDQNTIKNPYIFYPYDITNSDRADMIAFKAFNDPYASWVLYITNEILDPYYEWYLSNYQLNDFVKQKYGSIQNAMEKVAYYINNWQNGNNITPSTYDALTALQKTYYEPQYNNTKIIGYSRKKIDWKSSTNFILNIGITGPQSFIQDEIVTIKYQSNTSGKAQVLQSNSTNILVHHIFDDAFPHDTITIGPSSYIYGNESYTNCAITSCSFQANNIPADVQSYWAPVYYYDLENEKNEGNRTIRIMQQKYIPEFIKNTKKLLGQ